MTHEQARAAEAVARDFHVNGHALNDYESATATRIAVGAYLSSLCEELPEYAVDAAVLAWREVRESGRGDVVSSPIRAFLAALNEQEDEFAEHPFCPECFTIDPGEDYCGSCGEPVA